MPIDLTQSTQSLDDGVSGAQAEYAQVIRWTFPFPSLAPTWLESSRVVFGRDASADVMLPSAQVSRRHAAIARSGPLFLLSDLDSKNGVFINRKPVREAALSHGDVLRIGDCVGVFLRVPRHAALHLEVFAPDLYGGYLHRQVVTRLRELAASDLPVVFQGETGTGKERFARALHEWSGRAGRFLAVNCAAYSKAVAAAEFFGYRQGALSGRDGESSGQIRAAEHGTLLLDEMIELPLDVQAMLLRAIENKEVLPLGETQAHKIDVRFLAATQTPLAVAVSGGRFRADLRARLEGNVIALPPLRDCRELVPELFCCLFEKHVGERPELGTRHAERLSCHDWPLNIRELDTLVRRLAARHEPSQGLDFKLLDDELGIVPAEVPRPSEHASAKAHERSVPGREAAAPYRAEDIALLLKALTRHAGNITKAAGELGISRQKAYRMLEAAHDGADSSGESSEP